MPSCLGKACGPWIRQCVEVLDLTPRANDFAFREFAKRLLTADWAAIYFAGHESKSLNELSYPTDGQTHQRE